MGEGLGVKRVLWHCSTLSRLNGDTAILVALEISEADWCGGRVVYGDAEEEKAKRR